MKKLLLAATVVAFGVSPVMAQSGNTTTDSSGGAAASSTTSTTGGASTSTSTSGGSSGLSSEQMVASQGNVLKALQQAGYTEAKVMDAAYMVQAKTPNGELVLMMIDTSGRVMGAQAAPTGNATSGSSSSGSSTSGSSTDSSNSGSAN
ncbi:hypothetical protein [Tianweitania sediminis]|uniref:PepSY domain-containing protein n=1 Tax=Tianweitania sediminis TaxID=1502156 RepID=A0A8J7UJI1_9HYPH|nr:hypothetical protein [Tianweitania sediminis]MBP0438674.1 hypothetical protein [Tianweitania sediminis]